jgi:glyoxylase-like metal-dependent hydrolase (beta-lactamase superfamily II)
MIDYLALSHAHFDHVGNANMFSGSTWLVAKPERDSMFPMTPGVVDIGFQYFNKLKTSKTILIPADFDVFHDGTVIIKQAFGHSPGHSVLAVRLKETGMVLLAGDLYHYPEERALHRIGDDDAKTAAPQAREQIEAWAKLNHAQVWLAHDMSLFQRLLKSPGYYQ